MAYVFSVNQLITCALFGSLGGVSGSFGKIFADISSSIRQFTYTSILEYSTSIFKIRSFKTFDSSVESMKKVICDLIKFKMIHSLFLHYIMIYYGHLGCDLYYELHDDPNETYADIYYANPENMYTYYNRHFWFVIYYT